MGYSTDFTGELKFTRTMTKMEIAYIKTLMGYDLPDDFKGYIYPHGKPSYVQLELTKDEMGICWDTGEKFYNAVAAVNFVIDNAKKEIPDFGLMGQLEAQGEEIGDHWFLVIGPDGFAFEKPAPKLEDLIECPDCGHKFKLSDN